MSDLRLRKEIFDFVMIEKAVYAYGKFAVITIEDSVNYYELVFSQCFYEKNRTIAEFENYLIDLMGTKNDS